MSKDHFPKDFGIIMIELRLYIFSICLGLVYGSTATAQGLSDLALRSAPEPEVLTISEFYDQIIQHHPVVRQAQLYPEIARQEMRMARGGFDPKIALDYDRKEFDKKVYYNQWESKLKVPVWAGEVSLGFEQNHGIFLNPENTVDDPAGQALVGISIPIGRGLIIDARRAAIREARFFQDLADADRIKMINKVLLNAAKDYWDWYFAYKQYQLADSAYALAEQRYRGVVQNIRVGELAAIDSVKAQTAVQERTILRKEAELDLNNARIRVSNYLWGDNELPLVLEEAISPDNVLIERSLLRLADVDELINFAENQHPEIRKQRAKLQQLAVQERLQANNLLPTINLDYSLVRNTQTVDENTDFSFSRNYKVGVYFEFPLFLRKERGKLQQVRIKQAQSNFALTQVRREIRNRIRQVYKELETLRELINVQQATVNNYRILRDAEVRKFINGESELFLINTREATLIEGEIKLESLKSKYEKTRAVLLWEAGVRFWEE